MPDMMAEWGKDLVDGQGSVHLIMKGVKQVDLMDQQCYLETEHAAKAGKGKLSARS